MLKLPKGFKKKKKGKKSKRKGEDELFTEEELEKYRREHQKPAQSGEPSAKENEEWSKFKDLTTGVDSVLRRTQGDLDRIKSTSFFQRAPPVVKELAPAAPPQLHQAVAQVTAADFPGLAPADDADASDAGLTDDDDEDDDDQDDIFDTSYVDAVERGEVKLACVPDSPEEQYDDLFDTSHLDALIRGEDPQKQKGKKGLDIGLAVGVLTGRIDNVTVTTTKRSKRVIPGDLLLESDDTRDSVPVPVAVASEPQEKSILDTDADIPITTPIDLSVSLHTSLIQQNIHQSEPEAALAEVPQLEEEDDEFTLLAAESLEVSAEVTKFEQKETTAEPVLQESWSVFEADKNTEVFAEGVAEDQIDILDPYLDQDDPFDTSFADAVVPAVVPSARFQKEAVILEDNDDFDPRAEENQARLNNRRKSSVRIHLTDPSGIRESITSDDLGDKEQPVARDLLGGSSTDLTQLGDSPLDPVDINESEIDPFDTTIVDKIVAPGKVELKLLEQELIGANPAAPGVYRVPSDPDFDPRADEPSRPERRASRPENLVYNKSVVFDVDSSQLEPDKPKIIKPLTPYYTRELSITEDLSEEAEAADAVPDTLTRARSDEDIAPKFTYQVKRRHSELPQSSQTGTKNSLLETGHGQIRAKVLTPSGPLPQPVSEPVEVDPFDTSFAGELAPTKTELKLLAKEFSCDDTIEPEGPKDLLDPSDDIFQIKALTPEPSDASRLPHTETDPFDTSFASDLQPGRTELKLLESEFLH